MLGLREKGYRHAAVAAMLGATIVALLTFRHYGITWDEELQSQYGQAIVDYYASGFKDQRYAEIFNLYLYGGMFDGLASLIDAFTPFSVYETRHLVNAFFGLLGLWGTWRLGRLVGGGAVGLLSLIFLLLTPVYYGHMYNNPKDIPFACGIVWTLYYMARCLAYIPKVKIGLLIRLAIVLGLTLGVRVGGVMVIFFWCVPLAWAALKPLQQNFDAAHLRQSAHLGGALLTRLFLPIGLLSYAVMLLCWPWAQQHPLLNPLRALGEFSNFPQDVEVLLNGAIYRSTQLPWYYVPLYIAIQLPELILLLLAAGIWVLPPLILRRRAPSGGALALILLMAFIPILYAILRHPALYDAARHFLFTLPLLCILAALTARTMTVWAVRQFEKNWSRQAVGAGCVIVLALHMAIQIIIMAKLHPYEYIYANRFVGGVAGIYGRFELDYWGTSFKEAAERIQVIVAKEGGVPPGKIIRIAICGPWDAAMIYLPPDFQAVVANEPAEFFLSTTRWMCQNMRQGRELTRIERMEVPLSVVKDLRQGG